VGEPDLRRVLHKLSVSSPWTPSSSEGFAPRTAALRFSQPGAGFARLPPCWGWDGRERSGGNYPDTGGMGSPDAYPLECGPERELAFGSVGRVLGSDS